jgi:hypothetical protein
MNAEQGFIYQSKFFTVKTPKPLAGSIEFCQLDLLLFNPHEAIVAQQPHNHALSIDIPATIANSPSHSYDL